MPEQLGTTVPRHDAGCHIGQARLAHRRLPSGQAAMGLRLLSNRNLWFEAKARGENACVRGPGVTLPARTYCSSRSGTSGAGFRIQVLTVNHQVSQEHWDTGTYTHSPNISYKFQTWHQKKKKGSTISPFKSQVLALEICRVTIFWGEVMCLKP